MIRNLKVLGLAVTAVLAMSAVWAVAAQASLPVLQCTTNDNKCTITGTEIIQEGRGLEHVFNVEGGNVRCRSSFRVTVNLTGSGTDRRSTNIIPNIVAEYTRCRAFGVAATVNMNNCEYTFTGQTDNNRVDTANVGIRCNAGTGITVSATSIPCTITVPPQTGLQHVVFNNQGNEPTHVLAKITVAGIEYTEAENTCPRRGTFRGGTYNGETTLEAFKDDGTAHLPENQVGLHVLTPAT